MAAAIDFGTHAPMKINFPLTFPRREPCGDSRRDPVFRLFPPVPIDSV
jgi:hypothetical protein